MKNMNMSKKIGIGLGGILLIYALCSIAYSQEISGYLFFNPNLINMNNQNSGTDNAVVAKLFTSVSYYNIESHDIALDMGYGCGIEATEVQRLDGHYEIYFDRAEIQTCAIENGLVGEYDVTVSGSITPVGYESITFSEMNQIEFKYVGNNQ